MNFQSNDRSYQNAKGNACRFSRLFKILVMVFLNIYNQVIITIIQLINLDQHHIK